MSASKCADFWVMLLVTMLDLTSRTRLVLTAGRRSTATALLLRYYPRWVSRGPSSLISVGARAGAKLCQGYSMSFWVKPSRSFATAVVAIAGVWFWYGATAGGADVS